MRLYLDTSNLTFMVTKSTEAKKDQEGEQKFRRDVNGEKVPMWTTQVLALDEQNEGGETIAISTAGAKPETVMGAKVRPVRLEAIPWSNTRGSGVAYRADDLELLNGSKPNGTK